MPAGQFLAIVGKSGCGKSTLLRLLVGLDEPTGGRISFLDDDGEPATPNAAHRLPGAAPAALGQRRRQCRGRARRGRRHAPKPAVTAAAALAEVQLDEKAGEWPARLSGGQRQRVALARALVSRPSFLALDEPLGALDALTRITMQGLVERVWQEQGFTALFVTHDVGEAVALADRVIVLDEGRIALDSPSTQPRPRERGAADLAELEGRLLKAVFRQ